MEKRGLSYYKELLGVNQVPSFLIKYLSTPCLTRLKNIGYFCGMDYASKDIYAFKEYISRYDHSLTAALMTWNFTKRKEDTLAALFHDVATPCFSHVIDYMNKDYLTQESTEEYTGKILRNSFYLKTCLKEDNLKIEDIINFKNYSIVDNNRPKICVDRLDGIILTGYGWTKEIQEKEIKEILSQARVYINSDYEEEIGFESKQVAKQVVKYNQSINAFTHSLEDTYMMELLASITRLAIKECLISYEDLFRIDEKTFFNILNHSNCKAILEQLRLFYSVSKKDIPKIENACLKDRVINPLVRGKRLNHN